MISFFELTVGCSEDGTIRGRRAPLFVLRAIRDREVGVLELCLSDLYDNERWSLREAIEGLVTMPIGRPCYVAALRDAARRDLLGGALQHLETCETLCRLVARRERRTIDELKTDRQRHVLGEEK